MQHSVFAVTVGKNQSVFIIQLSINFFYAGKKNICPTFFFIEKVACNSCTESCVVHIREFFFEILLNQTKIRLYLPFYDWFGTANGHCPFAVTNQTLHGKYNLISVWFSNISKKFLADTDQSKKVTLQTRQNGSPRRSSHQTRQVGNHNPGILTVASKIWHEKLAQQKVNIDKAAIMKNIQYIFTHKNISRIKEFHMLIIYHH